MLAWTRTTLLLAKQRGPDCHWPPGPLCSSPVLAAQSKSPTSKKPAPARAGFLLVAESDGLAVAGNELLDHPVEVSCMLDLSPVTAVVEDDKPGIRNRRNQT